MYYSLVSLLAIALHMIINHDVLWGNDGSDLIRAHKPTGCVVRDPATFLGFYREFMEGKKQLPANFRG